MKTQLHGALRADRGQHEQQGRVRQPAWPVLWAGLLLSARHHNKQPSPRVTHTPQRQIYPTKRSRRALGEQGERAKGPTGPAMKYASPKVGLLRRRKGRGDLTRARFMAACRKLTLKLRHMRSQAGERDIVTRRRSIRKRKMFGQSISEGCLRA